MGSVEKGSTGYKPATQTLPNYYKREFLMGLGLGETWGGVGLDWEGLGLEVKFDFLLLQRHHYHFTVCILRSESCNILEQMSQEEYERALDLISHVILCTDLQTHMHQINEMKSMVASTFFKMILA